VAPGGSVEIINSTVTGGLTSDGATGVRLCGSRFGDDVTIKNSTGPVRVGGGGGCAGNDVAGNLVLNNNTGGVVVGGNRINGKLACSGNTSIGNSGSPNAASSKTGQCSGL
jgi:hypothetical protein